jgi:hypothetical protein
MEYVFFEMVLEHLLRPSLFWMMFVVPPPPDVSGQHVFAIVDCLILEDWTDTLSRIVGNQLQTHVVLHPKTVRTSATWRRTPEISKHTLLGPCFAAGDICKSESNGSLTPSSGDALPCKECRRTVRVCSPIAVLASNAFGQVVTLYSSFYLAFWETHTP